MIYFEPNKDCNYRIDYPKIIADINQLVADEKFSDAHDEVRRWSLEDLFFYMHIILRVAPINHSWLLERIYEVQNKNSNTMDLWSREHWKSSIITFGLNMWDVTKNPEERIGIFSHTRGIAKSFLRKIKHSCESNANLWTFFPEVFWKDPKSEAPKWALDINTPVLTIEGWKNHGALQVGDQIFGKDGQIITVIGNSGPMTHLPCRRIEFDDCTFVASSDHLWPIKHKTGQRWEDFELQNVTTDELPIRDKFRHCLPTPVIHPEPILPTFLHPYVLGLWLGDGTAGTNIISMHRDDEQEILDQLSILGFKYYIHRRNPEDNFSMYGINYLKEALEIIGCLRDKHVPARYMLGTKAERLALLQGLMDSDGTCKKEGSNRCAGMCMFSNTNWSLAFSVFQLATSLGLRPSIITHYPKDSKQVYQIYFVGIKHTPPFRLSRKLEKCKDARHKAGRYVRSITEIESCPVNCIKVDAVDGIYLAGLTLTPTHNSEDDGLIVKRQGVYQEATFEAWGLVDGQPTSKHFTVLNYDDVVTLESVSTPDQLIKTEEAFRISLNLGEMTIGRKRLIGTNYHFRDLYTTQAETGIWDIRRRICTDDGSATGNPVLLTKDQLKEKRLLMGPYVFSCQMLLNPVAEENQVFLRPWLRYYRQLPPKAMNLYLFCDPASGRKEKQTRSDYTVYWLWGLDPMKNVYLVDMIRDRLNLVGRWDALKKMMQKHPKIIKVYYEQYALQADIEHFRSKMGDEGIYFQIEELGGKLGKGDRIQKLVPMFEGGRVYLPEVLYSTDGKRDLVKEFIEEEYLLHPFAPHDDMLDAASRLLDEKAQCYYPTAYPDDEDGPSRKVIQLNNWSRRKAGSRYAYA